MSLKDWIKKCEGYSQYPYKDTVGKTTIGWGRNIQDNGIRIDEAELMLENDINRAKSHLSAYPWYSFQPQGVQDALVNMCFNMDINRLLGFKRMIMALSNKDYTTASQEALNSKWASQVGNRAKDVAVMIRDGK